MNNSDNPWLSIPAADYEAHMASPEVGQLPFLNAVFMETLTKLRPSKGLRAWREHPITWLRASACMSPRTIPAEK
jgi:hypothetical protein